MTNFATLTLEEFVAEARRLRAAADSSEREFMMYLREADLANWWMAHAATFAALLKKYDLCAPERYANACRALDLVPLHTVKTIGMHGSVALLSVPPEKRDEAAATLMVKAQNNGVPLSAQTARSTLAPFLDPKPPPMTEAAKLRQRIEQVEQENKRLRRELREKEREIARLNKQLGKQLASAS
jgi:hypothetical protein